MAADEGRSGKINLGLSVKFEAKVQKVIDRSRKIDRCWEFSQTTVGLIKEYKVTGVNIFSAGFFIPCPCRKNFLRSCSISRRTGTVNRHCSDLSCGCLKLIGVRFPQVIQVVPRPNLRCENKGTQGLTYGERHSGFWSRTSQLRQVWKGNIINKSRSIWVFDV